MKRYSAPPTDLKSFLKRSFPKILLALSTSLPSFAYTTVENPLFIKKNLKYVEPSFQKIIPLKKNHPSLVGGAKTMEVAVTLGADLQQIAQAEPANSDITPRTFLKMFPLAPEKYGIKEKPKKDEPTEATAPQKTLQQETPQEKAKTKTTPSKPAKTPKTTPPAPLKKEALFLEEEEPIAPAALPIIEEEEQTLDTPQTNTPTVETVTTPTTAARELETLKEDEEVIEDIAPKGYLINFSNVSIIEYLRFISRITNKNFIFNEDQLDFTISFVSEEPTTVDDIMAALMQELRIHNLLLIEEGNNLIIHANPGVNSPATVVPRPNGEKVPENAQLVTRVFRLATFDPTRASQIIRPLLSQQSVIEPLPETGFLILTDLKVNVDRVAELIDQLDSPQSGLDVGQYRSKNVLVDALALLAERVLTPIAEGKQLRFIPLSDTNTLFIISTPALVKKSIHFFEDLDGEIDKQRGTKTNESDAGGGRTPLGKDDLSPRARGQGGRDELIGKELIGREETIRSTERGDESTPDNQETGKPLTPSEQRALGYNNVFGSPLGSPISGGAGNPLSGLNSPQDLITGGLPIGHIQNTDFQLYRLEHRKGDQIQVALQQIAESMMQVQGTQPESSNELLSAISSVQWIEASNTLVFTGTPAANVKLKKIIYDLDVPNQQVLIEMLLLDTSISDAYNFGVNWGSSFGGEDSAGAQAFLSNSSPLTEVLQGTTGSSLSATGLAQTQGFNLGIVGRTISFDGITFNSLGALVSALHTNNDSRVVLNQKIVAEENNPAESFVGLNVPFRTQSLANDFGTILTTNVEYRDVGARIKVTPIVNTNGIITLEIEQELSTLTNASQLLVNATTFDSQSSPAITTRKSNSYSRVFVPNGYFVIMSGTLQDENERNRNQVPCLGGVPVLGAAFSVKENRENKRNLMIFIRPSLINTKDEIVEMTKRQQDIFNMHDEPKALWDYEIQEALDLLNVNDPNCRCR